MSISLKLEYNFKKRATHAGDKAFFPCKAKCYKNDCETQDYSYTVRHIGKGYITDPDIVIHGNHLVMETVFKARFEIVDLNTAQSLNGHGRN